VEVLTEWYAINFLVQQPCWHLPASAKRRNPVSEEACVGNRGLLTSGFEPGRKLA
jgi:hypothetical protein